ncbi:hemagglutinin, partial [Ciceribacter sp. RN22]|nr:hemagglutinin [Ciceribacter sp. RN22]
MQWNSTLGAYDASHGSGSPQTIANVAAGVNANDAVNVSQLSQTVDAARTHYYSVNDGGTTGGNYNNDGATGQFALAAGVDATAGGEDATAVGHLATATGAWSVAVGRGANAAYMQGVALGKRAQAMAIDVVAIGSDAYAAANVGDVALGARSYTSAVVNTTGTTINGIAYTYAGTASSTVSVGQIGLERTITNVAAGRVSATSTDAINGSQLFATNQAVDSLATDALQWNTTLGAYDASHGSGSPQTIANVAAGVNANDAVNVSQLSQTVDAART